MEIGISTGVAYRYDLIESLPLIRKAGFVNIEVWGGRAKQGERVHYDYTDAEYTRALKDRTKDLGIKVVSLHAPFSGDLDISHVDEEKRRDAVSQLKKAIDSLEFLEGNILVFHPSTAPARFDNLMQKMFRLSQAKKSIAELIDYCQTKPIHLALENQLPHILCGYSVDLLKLVWEVNSKKLGICFDSSHCNLSENVYEVLKKFRPWLIALHISDNMGSEDEHSIPGKGNIKWDLFVETLKAIQYTGVFMLEILGQSPTGSVENVLKEAYDSAQRIFSRGA